MFPSLSSLFFVFILFIYEAYATPLPENTDTVLSPALAGYLAVGLCLPFIILAVLKYAYLKFRRAQTIHNSTRNESPENCVLSPSVSIHEQKSPLVGLGLEASSVSAAGVLHLSPGLVSEHPIKPSKWRILRMGTPFKVFWPFGVVKVDIQAYLVGFLGSPEWETRIKVRRDKVARKDLASCSTPGSALSPCSTISRYPGASPYLSPYLPQASGTASRSQTVSTSFNTSTRTRSVTANYGSVTSSSQPSSSHRSRKSHRRSTSGPSSRGASGPSTSSGQGTSSSKGSGSHRHSRSSRTGSTNSKAHSRSLSLSFLEMNSPDVAEPAADFARVATRALESVSGSDPISSAAVGSSVNTTNYAGNASTGYTFDPASGLKAVTCTRGAFLPVPLYSSVSCSDTRGINDCASVHPGSPPCSTATPIPPFSSASGSGLHFVSTPVSRSGLGAGSVDGNGRKRLDNTGLPLPRMDMDTLEVKAVESRTPYIQSQPSPYLSPYYFSPSAFPLSPSISSPSARVPTSPVLELTYEFSDARDREKRTSTGSTSSVRLNFTVSVTPSPTPSPAPSRKPSPSPSRSPSPAIGRLTPSKDANGTYLAPTRSSVAKERTRPLNISRQKSKEGEKEDDDVKKGQERLSFIGLGLSPSGGKKAKEDKETFVPSLSGCEARYRVRSSKHSPAMPGAMPVTPTIGSTDVSSSSSASSNSKNPSKTLALRGRAVVSGPTTPNPDSFLTADEGSGHSGKSSGKGASSEEREEVEGLLVFGANLNSGLSAQERERGSWTSWDLDDLMTNDGKLDVDAVSAVLGLGVAQEDDAWSLEARSVHSLDHMDGVDEQLESSLESLIRQPGSQLYPIIEEEDDTSAIELPHTTSRSALLAEEAARPTSYLVVSGQSQLQIPFLNAGRESMLTVSTTDVRGSINESVLELDLSRLNVDNLNLNDLQLNVSGFDIDSNGFNVEGVSREGERSLFGVSRVERNGGEGGVGVAF